MSISKLFSLDLWKNKPITIDVKQNDAGRNININLKANGEEVDLTGKTVKYFIKKGDGNTVFNNCNIVEGKIGSILVPLTNQAITIEGTNEMELAIYDENGAVESTFTVYLQVTKTLIDDNAIESSNEFKALNDALGMVQGIDNKFKAVNSQLEHIVKITDDGYLYVDSIPNIIKYSSYEECLANIDECNNASILQTYIDNYKKIKFGKGFYPFEKYLSIKRGTKITSENESCLYFPKSKGFVTDVIAYIADMKFDNLNIRSKDNCFDFINDSVTYPYNVYMSDFTNLKLFSENGHCMYGGNIRGKGGDQLCFDLKFENIKVNAPNGSGFYGFSGLMTFYTRITDWGNIKYVFQNCTGIWRDCNTSFAGAEYFLYYDNNGREHYTSNIEMYNVNMETVSKGGIYIEKDKNVAHFNIILENSNVTIKPTIVDSGVQKLSIHPIHLGVSIKNLKVLNSRIMFENNKSWSDIYDLPESLMSIGSSASINNVEGNNLILYDRATKMTRKYNNVTIVNNPVVMDYYTESYYKTNESHSFNFVGGRVQNFKKDLTITSDTINLSSEKITYDGLIFNNLESNYVLRCVILKNVPTSKIFTIFNKTSYNITVNSADGFATKFILKNDATSKIIEPNKGLAFLYIGMDGIKSQLIEI